MKNFIKRLQSKIMPSAEILPFSVIIQTHTNWVISIFAILSHELRCKLRWKLTRKNDKVFSKTITPTNDGTWDHLHEENRTNLKTANRWVETQWLHSLNFDSPFVLNLSLYVRYHGRTITYTIYLSWLGSVPSRSSTIQWQTDCNGDPTS